MTRAEAVVAPFRGGLGGGKVGVAGGCEGGGGRLTPLSTFIAKLHTPLPEANLMQITYLPVSGAESIIIRSLEVLPFTDSQEALEVLLGL
jgi:hypothetical protein